MVSLTDYSTSAQLLALHTSAEISPRLLERLLRHFGTPEGLLSAEVSDLVDLETMTPDLAQRIAGAFRHLDAARDMIDLLAEREIEVANHVDHSFPSTMGELNDPPALLYVRGHLPDPLPPLVTLAGADEATAEGIETTAALVKTLIPDVGIVTGLTSPIDVAAQLAVGTAGGASYTILDCGMDEIADEEAIAIATEIAERGGVISEYPVDRTASPNSMQESNRLLCGFSRAVVITEVYATSERALDLLTFCEQIGKLCFVYIEPSLGALADESALTQAVDNGAIIVEGIEQVDLIRRSLV